MTQASLEHNMRAARDEHLVPGREVHLHDMRGYRYCEVGLISGTNQDNDVVNIWNTTGACDPTPEQLDALDANAIARDNGASRAWLGPVRRWTFDRLDVWEAGDDKPFGSVTGTWMGMADAATMPQAFGQRSYDPAYSYGSNTLTFSRGTEVYLLDAPDGEVFVMRSCAEDWDPRLNDDKLADLGSRLDLPGGWGFRTDVLDQDLVVSSAKHDNLAHIVQDNLHNVYQGSDVGRAFSLLCRQDAER
jgi:hypothetical protein